MKNQKLNSDMLSGNAASRSSRAGNSNANRKGNKPAASQSSGPAGRTESKSTSSSRRRKPVDEE